jgi:hypothetical protein
VWGTCVAFFVASGTCLAAAAAGVPQLPLPLFFDQPLWAQRIAALGLDGSSSSGSGRGALATSLASLLAAASGVDETTRAGDEEEEALSIAEGSFTAALAAALAACLSTPSRLRAACFGKRLRDELWPAPCADAVASAEAAAVGWEPPAGVGVFALAAAHGLSCGVAVAVAHVEREAAHGAESRPCDGGEAEDGGEREDGGEDEEGTGDEGFGDEEHDEFELPNGLWVESLGHEETAFLYQVQPR